MLSGTTGSTASARSFSILGQNLGQRLYADNTLTRIGEAKVLQISIFFAII